MDVDACCPDWDYQHTHAPNCFYATETWPRIGRKLIDAVADWAEKKLMLEPGEVNVVNVVNREG